MKWRSDDDYHLSRRRDIWWSNGTREQCLCNTTFELSSAVTTVLLYAKSRVLQLPGFCLLVSCNL
jgi:hypothetical protein